MSGKQRELARSDAFARIGFSPGIGEGRAAQAEFARALVHHPREIVLRTGNPFSQRYRSVVSRLYDQAADQVLDAYPTMHFEKHGRPMRRRAPCPPGVLRYFEMIVEMEPSFLQFTKYELGGHQFGHRGGGHRRIRA